MPAYVEVQAQRKRRYPKWAKRVPKNLKLTPVTLAHWFAGDGTCNSEGGSEVRMVQHSRGRHSIT